MNSVVRFSPMRETLMQCSGPAQWGWHNISGQDQPCEGNMNLVVRFSPMRVTLFQRPCWLSDNKNFTVLPNTSQVFINIEKDRVNFESSYMSIITKAHLLTCFFTHKFWMLSQTELIYWFLGCNYFNRIFYDHVVQSKFTNTTCT